jgi:hypothetical protein
MPMLDELMAEDDANRLAIARAEIAREKAEWDALTPDEKAVRIQAVEDKYANLDTDQPADDDDDYCEGCGERDFCECGPDEGDD